MLLIQEVATIVVVMVVLVVVVCILFCLECLQRPEECIDSEGPAVACSYKLSALCLRN